MRGLRRIVFLLLAAALVAVSQSQFVEQVRSAIAHNDFQSAAQMVQSYQSQRGATPELAEAVSWLARGELARSNYDAADQYAKQAYSLATQQLAGRSVDVNENLATALGAAIEVHAQVLAAKGNKAAGAQYLRSQLAKYGSTSIGDRIQKNLNMLTLPGSPAPALDEARYIGAKPPTLVSLRGKPVLMYFWAHWCVDCKAEAPILARLKSEYAGKGLTLIGPTQLYGSIAQGQDAPPAAEMQYIEQVRDKYYADLRDVTVPVSAANFKRYGASTTPTLVLIDRAGRVAMYHPGRMTYDELRAKIDEVVGGKHS
jgi:thiol-disulfide isomerase/thioredoxin